MNSNSKMFQLFSKVRALFAEMSSVQSDRGELYFDAPELAVDVEVFLKVDNDFIPAPSGEYVVGDKVVKVEDGVVVEIELIPEPVNNPEPEIVNMASEEMACGDKKTKAEEEVPAEVVEEVIEEPKEDPMEELRKKLDSIEERLIALEAIAKPIEMSVDENSRYSRVMNFVKNL